MFLILCARLGTSTRQVSDAHLDAKVFPVAHVYGTGSVNAEGTSVQPQRVCRNRLLSLQCFFRRSSRYAFWQLDMMIKRHLYFFNLHRARSHYKSAAASDDKFAQAFGTIIPRDIPESSAWWKAVLVCSFDRLLLCLFDCVVAPLHVSKRGAKVQSKDLAAICDDAESCLPLAHAVSY